MNRKLRNRHRIVTTTLAVIVPVVFLAGLAVRPDIPTTDTLPGVIVSDTAADTPVTIGGSSFGYALVLSNGAPAAVVLEGHEGIDKADVLVYWSAASPAGLAAPVDGSYLVGTLAPLQQRLYSLPSAATQRDAGYLSFYSLASREFVRVEPDGALRLRP